ncbi:MAG TPA: hypothetical protein VGN72_01615 [Tepidisphaeraceae bacterium]|jgi:hypothetical protein|nr:hypothetical protein [Tepidisphaeraceae bacterium]
MTLDPFRPSIETGETANRRNIIRMMPMPPALLLALLVVGTMCTLAVRATEEDIVPWDRVSFTTTTFGKLGPTTVVIESSADDEGKGARRVTAVTLSNERFRVEVPPAALLDLDRPMVNTALLVASVGPSGEVVLYVTFKLGNPSPGQAWDVPTVYLKIVAGRFDGRFIRRTVDGRVTFEELPLDTHEKGDIHGIDKGRKR